MFLLFFLVKANKKKFINLLVYFLISLSLYLLPVTISRSLSISFYKYLCLSYYICLSLSLCLSLLLKAHFVS